MSVQGFYDELAPLYHLVYQNWEATVAQQGTELASLIGEHWGASARTVLDAAVGIGTQALDRVTMNPRQQTAVTPLDLTLGHLRIRRKAPAQHLT